MSLISPDTELRGAQFPTVEWSPPATTSAGAEAVELARVAGLDLDAWQEHVLARSLAEREDGTWAALEVGLVVPRQNGKDAILEARELAGLFLLGERLIIHSAHEFSTSLEHFLRLEELITSTPEMLRRLHPTRGIRRASGKEGFELRNGQRMKFRTRTKSGGRGLSGDLVVLNEAMILLESSHGALMPTMAARPNPQLWYAGSAVDQLVHEHGGVLAGIRERGHAGGDPRLAYFEWAAGDCAIEDADELAQDPEVWAASNPGLGIRISTEYIEAERRSLTRRIFATERLGIGDWPSTGATVGGHFDVRAWRERTDPESTIVGRVAFAYDISPDRSTSAIAAAGRRADGRLHVEVVDHRPATGWVAQRLHELVNRHQTTAPAACDAAGPSASLLATLGRLGVEVRPVTARVHAQACGSLHDAVTEDALRHLGTPDLEAAVGGAARRTLGDAWAWARKQSSADITPLVAATLAAWALDAVPAPTQPSAFFEVVK